MRLRFHFQNQVARLPVEMRFALRREDGLLTIDHAGLNFHFQSAFLVDQLNVRTLVADSLLHHLETAGAQVPRYHLLAAVALSRAVRRLHDGLVPRDFDKSARVQVLQGDHDVHYDVGPARRLLVAPVVAVSEREAKVPKETGKRIEAVVHHAVFLEAVFPAAVIFFSLFFI